MTSSDSTRVLKANSIRELGSSVAFNYEDIRRRSDEHIERAQQKAAQILRDVQIEAEEIRKQAHQQGKDIGRAEGVRDVESEVQRRATEIAEQMADEKLKTTLPAMLEAIAAVERERDRWLTDWEDAAVRLSVAIAEKIIRRELHLNPESVTGMMAEVLQLVSGNTSIKLRLHPEDLACLGDHAEEVVRSMASCAEAEIVPDESISRGGCVISTRDGLIDSQIETQLERIASELLQSSK